MASKPSGTTNREILELPVVMVSTWAKFNCAMDAREALTTRISSRRKGSVARASRSHPSAGELARWAARFAGPSAAPARVGVGGASFLAAAVVLVPLLPSPGLPAAGRSSSERLDDDRPAAGKPGDG